MTPIVVGQCNVVLLVTIGVSICILSFLLVILCSVMFYFCILCVLYCMYE